MPMQLSYLWRVSVVGILTTTILNTGKYENHFVLKDTNMIT